MSSQDAKASADPALTHVAQEFVHNRPITSCRFDPTGKFVFGGSQDNQVHRWELATGTKVSFKFHDSWVYGLEFSGDGTQLISGGCDGRLAWWEAAAAEPKPIRTVDAHAGWVRMLHRSRDGKMLISGGNDNLAKIWNIADGSLVATLTGHTKNVYSVLFHEDGKHVLTGDLAGVVKQWEIESGKLVREIDAKVLYSYNGGQQVDFGGVRSMGMSADGKWLACGGLQNASNPLGAVHDPVISLVDWETGKQVKVLTAGDLKGSIWRSLFHANGFLIGAAGGSSGGHLLFWKTDAEKNFHQFQLPNLVRDMDMHPDGIQIATAHYDSRIRISKMIAKA